MRRCIIIEDEQNAREFIENLIQRYFSSKIVVLAACASIAEGVEAIKKFKPDLVFLDIQMPNERGFKLFEYFDNINFEVIFTTAHKEFAIEAIQHSAQDYLLKPISQLDLADALKRLEKKQQRNNNKPEIGRIIEQYNADPFSFGKIALATEKGFILEKIGNILFAEAQGNYTKIFTYDDRTILVCKTLGIIEGMLPEKSFFRVHKSYIVNLNYVTKYDKSIGLFVELINGAKIPVSVRNNTGLIHAITSKI
jgi:two-component system LytT family response regulator